MRKAKDYRQMTTQDLRHEYLMAKEELFRLRYRVSSHQMDNTKSIWRARKEIARLATVLVEREAATDAEESAGS